MHPTPLRRVSWLLPCALVLASLARAAPPAPPADSLVGMWRSADSKQLIWVSQGFDEVVTFTCPGRFKAFTQATGTGYVGLSRSPDHDSTRAYKFSVLHVVRVGPTRLEASFSRSVDKPGAETEGWEFAGMFGGETRTIALPHSDSTLPKPGDMVYVEELPEVIERVPPTYPEWARKKGVEGTVMVQVLVGKDGLVKDARVVASIPELDDYAKGADRQWRFRPATSKGQPIAVWVAVPVKFSLH
jgi:TonB family protein